MSLNKHVLLLIAIGALFLFAQPQPAAADGITIGLLLNTDRASEGYTLFTPVGEGNTYLIDNDGKVVHSWDKGTHGNATPYLLEDGSIIGIRRGIIQYAWDGTLTWDFNLEFQGHHDIEVLPNGNVLLLAYDRKPAAEAIANGRDPDRLNTGELISERILEVRRTGLTTGEIVWEWAAWDHLIQDFDPAKQNFGVVGDHPELIDINFGETNPNGNDDDWLHANALDYNPATDQIMVTLRQFSELWVIDHSTATAEASTHRGGSGGLGGDLLYRWGNPAAYRAGGQQDQQLFVPHDAQWIVPGLPGEGNVLIFNNGVGRPEGYQSSVEEIELPVDDVGVYHLVPGAAYGPSRAAWSYADGNSFFSSIMSGVGRLPNGNTLITSGVPGRLFEVTPDGETVWNYANPLTRDGPLTQGDPKEHDGIRGSREVFRSYRYAPDYPAFAGRDLIPQGPLEIGIDSDGDGLLDAEETKRYGTDPFDHDTDSDGLSDYDEIFVYFTDPRRPPDLGDVDCDGDVDSIDAVLVLQRSARLIASLPCEDSGDVDGDNAITSIDAAVILQFTARLLFSLPA